ncbi:MAG: insulinase family protein [Bdellovibrionales bacterium]|nr:insulinase family protein [Bdellovibrionales bacterium]
MKAFLIVLTFLFLGCSSLNKKSFKLPDFKNQVQANGSKVLTIVDNSLPSFSAYALIGMGHIHDPKGKEGLSNFVVSMLDKGTKNYSAPKLAEKVDQLGARLQLSANNDYAIVSIHGLSIHQDQLLEILQEVLTAPKFSDAEIKRLRSQILARIVQRNDQPPVVASDAFDKMIYEKNHPYSQPSIGVKASIQKISKQDIKNHYNKHFVSKNISFAFTGRLGDGFETKLANFLSPIKKGEKPSLKMPTAKKSDAKILLVYKNDLKQAQVRLGHVAIKRSNPDYLKLKVATTILGGAFSSRLVDEIREKRGLTYSISSSFNPGYFNGPFIISSSTRNEKAGELVFETQKLVSDFVENGITSEELEMAVGYLKGTFPSLIETSEGLAFNVLNLQYYGVSDQYLRDYVKNLESFSKSDINQAIKTYIHPDHMQTLVYAPESVETQFKDSKVFSKKSQ